MTNHSRSLENDTIIDGTYRVLDFLGEGGMGVVYKVEHSQLNKILALKILKTNQLSEAVWQRFRNEAQAIARLEHRNIVKIYDMNQTDGGRPYYTMDFLTGESLADLLKGTKTLSLSQALHIFRQVCSGLAYAHSRGIIHRDIKPANIMLLGKATAEPLQVKIVDFGIAKLVDDDGHTIQGVTRPGEVFGSPLYMSPEQCTGSKLDGRSDMYSVAVTMFKALTGITPFRGRTAIETTMMHQSDAPPLLNSVSPDLQYPAKLERIIDKMLSKSPEQRYQSLAEVENELQKIQIKIGQASPVVSSIDQSRTNKEERDWDELTEPNDTVSATGEGTIEQKHHNLKWSLILLVASSTVVLASSILYALTGPFSAKKLQPIGPKADFKSPLAEASGMPTYSDEMEGAVGSQVAKGIDKIDQLEGNEVVEKSTIQDFLGQKFKPFSQKQKLKKGSYQTKFEFPEKFSIGQVKFIPSSATPKGINLQASAKGPLWVPVGAAVRFEANELIGDYPQLLAYFQPNDLLVLQIPKQVKRSSELIANIARLKGLDCLELPDSKLEAADLKVLEPLTNLRTLIISRSNLGGEVLAKSALIKQVCVLNIEMVPNIGPILAELNPNFFGLVINRCVITSENIEQIARLHNLSALFMNGCLITDSDLHSLIGLKKLTFLDLEGCDNLTSNCLPTIEKIKSLRYLTLPEKLDTEEFHRILRSRLPELKFVQPSAKI